MVDVNKRKMSVNQLMQQVRAETQRRSSGPLQWCAHLQTQEVRPRRLDAPSSVTLALGTVGACADELRLQALRDRPRHVREILKYTDRDFVHAAYATILHREPDKGGLETYLCLLRSGVPKLEILGFLLTSPEGHTVGARIPGLRSRLFLERITNWPVIGSIVHLLTTVRDIKETQRTDRALQGKLFALLEEIVENDARYVTATNTALRALEDAHNCVVVHLNDAINQDDTIAIQAGLQYAYDAVKRLRESVEGMASSDDVKHLREQNERLIRRLEGYEADRSALTGELTELRERLEGKAARVDLERSLDRVDQIDELIQRVEGRASDRSALTAELAELRYCLESKASLDDLQDLAVRWEDGRRRLEEDVQTKVSNAGLTELASHMSVLLDSRAPVGQVKELQEVTKRKVDKLEQMLVDFRANLQTYVADAIADITSTVKSLSQTKVGVDEFARDQSLLAKEIRAAQANVAAIAERLERISTEGLERWRRDQSASEVLLAEKVDRAELAILQESKADRSAVEAVERELRAGLEDVTNDIQREIALLTESKAERLALEALEKKKADNHAMEALRADARSAVENAAAQLRDEVGALSQIKANLNEFESLQVEVERYLQEMRVRGEKAAADATVALASQIAEIKRTLVDQERRLSLLLEEARKRLPKPLSGGQIKRMLKEEAHIFDSMYSTFEDIFRGSREDIKRRQEIYLPYVHAVKAGTVASRVIDLGCGRGEWLEILRDAGLTATGVDNNRVFIERCRELELDVVESDALSFLRELKPKSVGVITSFHLVEHLPHKILIACLDAAFRALRKGGLLILETPNPRNLQVASCDFYLDPTHRHPLPPDLMRYLTEARGFVGVEVKELHGCPDADQVTEGPTKINDVLNRHFFSARDYAIVGRKV